MKHGGPAYMPFYPVDFLVGTRGMSAEEVGAYITLLCLQWEEGYISDPEIALKQSLGCHGNKIKAIWQKIQHKFSKESDGFWRNIRLAKEREKAVSKHKKACESGKKGAEVLWGAHREPLANQNQNQNQNQKEEAAPLPVRAQLPKHALATKPERMLTVKHGKHEHLAGFCDWCCFPVDLAHQFAQRYAGEHGGIATESHLAMVRQWALKVRGGGAIPAQASMYEFWRGEWAKSYGSPTRKPTKADNISAILAQIREEENRGTH